MKVSTPAYALEVHIGVVCHRCQMVTFTTIENLICPVRCRHVHKMVCICNETMQFEDLEGVKEYIALGYKLNEIEEAHWHKGEER